MEGGTERGEDGKPTENTRSTLVDSIASNIFDTLKSNKNITQILSEVLDPKQKNKECLLKHLMSNKEKV